MFMWANAATAQSGLSKSDIIKLSQSGLSTDFITKRIQSEGINFNPSVDDLVELRKAQVPEVVLEALLAVKSVLPAAKMEPSFLEAAKALYSKADYAGLVRLVKQRLLEQPGDSSAHYLLGVAYLQLRQRNPAQAEADTLAKSQESSAKALAEKMISLLKRFDGLEAAKSALQEKLSRFDTDGVLRVIEGMDVPQTQRQILRVYLSVYRGRFELARHQLDGLQASLPQREEEWIQVRKFIDQSADEYRTYLGRLVWLGQANNMAWVGAKDVSFFVPQGLEDCQNPINWLVPAPGTIKPNTYKTTKVIATQAQVERLTALDQECLKHSIDAVSHIVSAAPVSETSLEWLFQVALFTRPYFAVESLGDRILAGQGHLIVPMTANGSEFQMTVDKNGGRLTLINSAELSWIVNAWSASWVEAGTPFSIGFEQIDDIHQSAKFTRSLAGSQIHEPRMFEIGSAKAIFTATPFLNSFGKAYGELASRQVVSNFGTYLIHVVNRPHLKAELIKQEVGGNGWNFSTAFLAVAAVASSAQGNTLQSAVLMDSLKRLDQENEATKLEQHEKLQAWEQLAADTSFNSLQRDLFREFDGVLEELH
jgi:hypothetical protein